MDYDTLLFNYYEYFALCLNRKLIDENMAKQYFKILVCQMADLFENSLMFKEDYANKKEYPGIIWLFKKWKILENL